MASDLAGEISEEDSLKVIASYFEKHSLVDQQIVSFNDFISNTIPQIIGQNSEIEVRSQKMIYRITFGKAVCIPPSVTEPDGYIEKMLPNSARLRNLTYSADLKVYVSMKVFKGKHDGDDVEELLESVDPIQISIGKIPVMLGSVLCFLSEKSRGQTNKLSREQLIELGECCYDQGGYFIINGVERVLIAQEKMSANHVYIFKKRQPNKYEYVAEFRSVAEPQNQPTSTMFVRMLSRTSSKEGSSGRYIRTTLPHIRTEIPIIIVFRALGFVSDKDILQFICDLTDNEMVELLRASIEEASVIQNQMVALEYIGKRGVAVGDTQEERIKYAKDILQKKMLPHVGVGEHCETKKAYNFGYIISQLLLCALGRRAEDDRDHLKYKRLDLAGPLMGELFQTHFKKLTRDVRAYVHKCVDNGKDVNLHFAIKARTITQGLKYSLATGNWGPANVVGTRAGVSQPLNRLTYASTLSHLRRVNNPIRPQATLINPRLVHGSTFGMICPIETPEGKACGLMKNLALMVRITIGSKATHILEILKKGGLKGFEEDFPDDTTVSYTKVFVNGCWMGFFHGDPNVFAKNLRDLRRQFAIDAEVGVVRDISNNELRIYTDPGRCNRPLFIVDKSRLVIKKKDIDSGDDGILAWDDLLSNGFIEYVDTHEEENTLICMTINELNQARLHTTEAYSDAYTHCEIHPSLILGVCASIIPLPNHNQSPRNTYQAAMGKQAMGVYATTYPFRMDTCSHILYYPQKPLVTTRAMDCLNSRQLPAGVNAIVAIACYGGYNQQDSVIMNQSSIDRGFFRSMLFRSYRDEEMKIGTRVKGKFGRPDSAITMGMKPGSYDKLEDDGLPLPGTRVFGGDIIIGKTASLLDEEVQIEGHNARFSKRDQSTSFNSTERGVIDQVMVTTNDNGSRLAKVKVRRVRIPQIGDKFSSRHGQKGTIGITYTQEDMPWTIEGISPDIIINPHSIPSRMTIGQFFESIMGKVAVLGGYEAVATPFTDVTVDEISKLLKGHGYQGLGNEKMYNGHTGRQLSAMIFIGPTYYQRLMHMVDDKIHSRARGPVEILTRQPTAGRSRNGGLRIGEMERDCIIAHGAAHFLKERLFDVSDNYRVHVCQRCGMIAVAKLDLPGKPMNCRCCRNSIDIVQVYIPYSCKLLFQELMAMGIAPRMLTNERIEVEES